LSFVLASLLLAAEAHCVQAQPRAPASKIIGGALVDARGNALGDIDDLIFDARNGALRWVVAESIAFPAGGLEPQAGGGYRLGKMRNARAMSPPQWPSMRTSALLHKEVIDRVQLLAGALRVTAMLAGAGGGRTAEEFAAGRGARPAWPLQKSAGKENSHAPHLCTYSRSSSRPRLEQRGVRRRRARLQ
jgi:hypothetical protein